MRSFDDQKHFNDGYKSGYRNGTICGIVGFMLGRIIVDVLIYL